MAQSPYEAHIELEQRIYNPGDVVSGQVLLQLDRPLYCDRIAVRLFGSVRVFFTEILKEPGPNFGKNRAYQQEQILVDQTAELWKAESGNDGQQQFGVAEDGKKGKGPSKTLEEIMRQCNPNAIRLGPKRAEKEGEKLGDGGGNGLPVGRHQFMFAFKLPVDGLYTSFDARNSAGSIRYHILIQAFNGGFNCLRRKLLFPVVCPKRLDELNLFGPAMEPVMEKASDKKELLKVELFLEKRGHVPGEPLNGTIRIENNSAHSVKRMCLRIVQRTTCYATKPEFGTHQSQFETAAMGLPVPKVRTGQSTSFPIRYYVPALVPAVCVPGCLESEHLLWLEVGNKRGVSVELVIPFLIGTHPAPKRRPSTEKPGPDEANEKVVPPPDGPPPLYEQSSAFPHEEAGALLMENVPPPSYAQSVAGLSELNEPAGAAADGGTSNSSSREQQQQQQQSQQYGGPLCYHYNFGFSPADDEEQQQSGNQQQEGKSGGSHLRKIR